MKLAAICDPDTAMGLRLAGVHEVFTVEKSPIQAFDELQERNDIGVVFINESLADTIGTQLKEFRLRNTLPIIVEIPDKHGKQTDHIDFVSVLVKRAVGIDVSKQKQ